MQIGKEMAIPSILKIGNGALGKIGSYLKTEGLDQVVLFFGNGLIDMFGELVMNSLKEADVNVLEYNELDTVDIDDIITLAFAIPNKAKAVISIGGGKVIDAGKYAAFPVPAHPFWCRESELLSLPDWLMALSWIPR